MESYRLRRLVIPISFTAVGVASLATPGTMPLPPPALYAVRILGAILFVLSGVGCYRIHRTYPKRHDRPSDFPRLMTEGPYAICRHPLYGLLMVNQLSIALTLASLWGLTAFVASIPLWLALIRVEERELIEYWGEQYIEYARRVPALIPIRIRRGASRGG